VGSKCETPSAFGPAGSPHVGVTAFLSDRYEDDRTAHGREASSIERIEGWWRRAASLLTPISTTPVASPRTPIQMPKDISSPLSGALVHDRQESSVLEQNSASPRSALLGSFEMTALVAQVDC